MRKKNRFGLVILPVVFMAVFSCTTAKRAVTENTVDYYTLDDVLKEMKLDEAGFMKLDRTDEFVYPVKDSGRLDSTAEALSDIYYDKTVLSGGQAGILNRYYPDDRDGVYRVVCEVLKARAESPEIEKSDTLIKYLKTVDHRSKVDILRETPDATSDVSLLSGDFSEFYRNYINHKIDHAADREFEHIRVKLGFSKKQVRMLLGTVRNIYFAPSEKSSDVLVIAGAVMFMIVNKQDMNGSKPYLEVYDAFSSLILQVAGKEYRDNWQKNVDDRVKKEGNKLLNDAMKYNRQE